MKNKLLILIASAMMVMSFATWATSLPPAPPSGVVPAVSQPSSIVMSTGDLAKNHTVPSAAIFQLPNPDSANATFLPTRFFCSGSGMTVFITSGSINESGTTMWTSDTGAALEVSYGYAGTSVFAIPLRGTWIRFY